MGWDVYDIRYTKEAVLRDLDKAGSSWELLASRLIGKVYWQVFSIPCQKNGVKRAIFCTLIERLNPDDGYAVKCMDEAMGPCYYDCPMKFIEIAGPSTHEGVNNWRREVAKYHEKRKSIDVMAREVKPGRVVVYGGKSYELIEPYKRSAWLVRQVETGVNFRMPKTMLREAIQEEAEQHVQEEIERSFAKPNETLPQMPLSQGILFA